jgi:dTDP-4-dehydrorhamnose 3,5-epimerase
VIEWEPCNEIEGCGIVRYNDYQDDRGYFKEVWNRKTFAEAGIPLPWNWAQDNVSFSHAGVLRGFHIQNKNPQGKLITCIYGRIMDVCLDLRRESPTFMKMTRVILDGESSMSFYCPPGTAHAFIALEASLVHYRCTTAYEREHDGGVNSSSPELAMVWPPGSFMRSEKDRALPMLVDYLKAMA